MATRWHFWHPHTTHIFTTFLKKSSPATFIILPADQPVKKVSSRPCEFPKDGIMQTRCVDWSLSQWEGGRDRGSEGGSGWKIGSEGTRVNDDHAYWESARSIGRSVARSLDRSVARSLGRSVARSLDRSIARSLNRSVAQSLGRSVARSLDRSIAQSLDRSIARSLGRLVAWSLFLYML